MPANAQLVFRLRIEDNSGAVASDIVKITSEPYTNQTPAADAGTDQTVSTGATVQLDGTGSSDPDGNIVKFIWTQISGSEVVLQNRKTATSIFAAETGGEFEFRLRVEDDRGAVKTDKVLVTAESENLPPVANAGPDFESVENSDLYLRQASGSDPDGTIANYHWEQISGQVAVSISSPDSARPTVILSLVDDDTEVVLRLTVTDDKGATGTDEVRISILEHMPPVAVAGPDQVVVAGAGVVLDGGGSYTQPGNSLKPLFRWKQVSGPEALIRYGRDHRWIQVTPKNAGDILVFELAVTDRFGVDGTDTVQIRTIAPGSGDSLPPIADAGQDHVSPVVDYLLLDASASHDPDGAIVDYQWEMLSGPKALYVRNDENPLNNYADITGGIYEMRLTVTDNTGATATDEVTITVPANPAGNNQAPSANAGNWINHTNFRYFHLGNEIDLEGSASDIDGMVVSTPWRQITGPKGTLIEANQLDARFIFGPYNGSGDHRHAFLLTATDDQGASASDHTIHKIDYVNSAPYAHLDEPLLVLSGTAARLNAEYSYDPDNYIDTFHWGQDTGLALIFDSNVTTAPEVQVQVPNFNDFAIFGLTLAVTDMDGAVNEYSETQSLSAVTHDHQSPSLEAGPDQVVAPGSEVTLSATGPDEYKLWVQLAGPRVSLADPYQFTTRFSAPNVTQDTVLIFAISKFVNPIGSHGKIITDADTVAVTIDVPNAAPVADAGTNQIAAEREVVQLDGTASHDPDGTIVHYQWQQISGPQVYPEGAATDVASFTAPLAGVDTPLDFELTVTDNEGETATAITTVTVRPDVNDGDIDGDGIPDEHDAFPNDSNDAYDFDGDSIGDNADTDRDGDGVDNASDYHPNDPARYQPPVLTITTPQEGTMIEGDSVLISGTLTAPPNTGVTINDEVAHRGGAPYGSEFAARVPLERGSNEITVTAILLSRKQMSQTLNVTRSGHSLFGVSASPDNAFAPATVEFTISNPNQVTIQQIELDYEGDGNVDQTIYQDFDDPIAYDYTVPGIYLPKITVVDNNNDRHKYDLVISIQTEEQIDQRLQSVWNGMNGALRAGNLGLANEHLTSTSQKGYGEIFYRLLPYMGSIISRYTAVVPIEIALTYGEYAVGENIDGTDRVFLIQLQRDSLGVWRVEGM